MSGTGEAATRPRLVVVAGSGRSGTSTIAGTLKYLGLAIPQPEVPGDRTNPRGFFEPRWVVDTQTRLLRRSGVLLTDARPDGFRLTAEASQAPEVREEVSSWLRGHVAQHPELVVKDPRNSWFLPMWRDCAHDVGADVGFLTMLRHPAEVVGSKQEYYKKKAVGDTPRMAQTTRVASWVNVALFTEVDTRGEPRAFLRYTDLLEDWRSAVRSTASTLGLSLADALPSEGEAAVDEFIDPALHRIRTSWDDIECPDAMREIAEEVWTMLCRLADNGGADGEAESRLDEARARYVELYTDSEAIAQSSVASARREGRKQAEVEARRAAKQARAAGPARGQQAAGRQGSVSDSVRRSAARARAWAVRTRARAGARDTR